MTRSRIIVDRVLGSLLRILVIALAVFLVAPFVVVLLTSFNSTGISFPPKGLSLESYRTIPELAIRAFGTSMLLGASSAVIATLLGVPAAFALVRGRLPGSSVIDAILRSPLQVPRVVLGIAFLEYFIYWQSRTSLHLAGTFAGLLVAHVLIVFPYILVANVARLSSLDPQLDEAAMGLGASMLQTQIRVVLPLLRPSIVSGLFLGFVTSFDDVAVTLFLVGAGTDTFPVYLFGSAQVSDTPSLYAAATVGALVAMALALLVQRGAGARTVMASR